jgi:hypothetical protein
LSPASIIVTPSTDQVERVEPSPTFDPLYGQKTLVGKRGAEIVVYPPAPTQPPPFALAYLMVGLPAMAILFLLIPLIQRLALRFRLLNR